MRSSKIAENLCERAIKSFMDVIILKHLKNQPLTSGYEVVGYFHRKFDILLSAGTVYSTLYLLERQNLIEGNMNQTKRVYKLTNQGEKFLDKVCSKKNGTVQAVLSSIFSEV